MFIDQQHPAVSALIEAGINPTGTIKQLPNSRYEFKFYGTPTEAQGIALRIAETIPGAVVFQISAENATDYRAAWAVEFSLSADDAALRGVETVVTRFIDKPHASPFLDAITTYVARMTINGFTIRATGKTARDAYQTLHHYTRRARFEFASIGA